MRQQCIAEIGRPGHIHGCRATATWKLPVKGTSLAYCGRHIRQRAADPSRRYHSGAIGPAVRLIQG